LLRSLAVLFGTAFVLKHLLLASLYSPDGGWLKRVTGALVSGVTQGTLEAPTFAPATGYISFFTLGLYIVGLIIVGFGGQLTTQNDQRMILRASSDRRLSADYTDLKDEAEELGQLEQRGTGKGEAEGKAVSREQER
jgi:hypothetical protein